MCNNIFYLQDELMRILSGFFLKKLGLKENESIDHPLKSTKKQYFEKTSYLMIMNDSNKFSKSQHKSVLNDFFDEI